MIPLQCHETELTERIEKIVRPHLKFLDEEKPVTPTDQLGELGLDSLASISLLFDLESEFALTIPDEALDENTFTSIASLETLVKKAQEV